MRKLSEQELGTEQMVEEMELAFLRSCEHNNTGPEDVEYFRRYVFNLICMLVNASLGKRL